MQTILILIALLAQEKKKVDPVAVENAIDKGGAFLVEAAKKGLPKAGHMYAPELGYGEFILYTMVHAGIDPSNEEFKKLLDQAATAPLKYTYQAVATALALEAVDREKHQNRIADCAQFLAENQCENGQWGYGKEVTLPKREPPKAVSTKGTKALPRIVIRRTGKGGDNGDNSNSQYAALGIRACAAAGCEFDPAILKLAAGWWEKSQHKDGAWGYYDTRGAELSYGSMTAGGMASLCIYRWLMKQDYKKDRVVLGAADWLTKEFRVDDNPKYPKSWGFYYLYALERAGILYGTERFGKHEWYAEGAEWLLKQQKADGSWSGPPQENFQANHLSETCFAILFLRRATKPLPKIATEDK
jgi:hypothetical protein